MNSKTSWPPYCFKNMKTVKKKIKKSKTQIGPDEIKRAYIQYTLEFGKKPSSLYKFCKNLDITEDQFYKIYGSFKAVEKSIWSGYVADTISRLTSDKDYSTFGAREKLLAFCFTLVENLKKDRGFVIQQVRKCKQPTLAPSFIKKFKKEFDSWANGVIEEGKSVGEIASRPFLDKRYTILLWFHLWFIIQFWSRDESPDFEKTDEAIERSVNLVFDLIGKGVVDNAFEFGKFLFQQRNN